MNTVKSKSIALFCLTPGGMWLTKRLAVMLPLTYYTNEALQGAGFIPFSGGFTGATREAFSSFPTLVFIGITGIAVRALAPLVSDKFSDPAVMVVDERARHVISLLSGHAEGTDALTCYPAGMLDADPVTTAATDASRLAAFDTLAFQLDAWMTDFHAVVRTVNQMLVSGMRVGLRCNVKFTEALNRCDQRGFIPVSGLTRLPAFDVLICVTPRRLLPPLPVPYWKLVPQRVMVRIGRRRDTPCFLLCSLLDRQLAAQRLDPLALKTIGSASLKTSEPGLCQLVHHCRVPFEALSAEMLRKHGHRFPASSFIREMVGVGSVSGPVTWLLSQGNLLGKTLHEQGVAITLGVTC